MTDIVERLRALASMYHQHGPHYAEAADEIERLRAEREHAVQVQRNASGALDAARDEIERLCARIKDLEEQVLTALGESHERPR